MHWQLIVVINASSRDKETCFLFFDSKKEGYDPFKTKKDNGELVIRFLENYLSEMLHSVDCDQDEIQIKSISCAQQHDNNCGLHVLKNIECCIQSCDELENESTRDRTLGNARRWFQPEDAFNLRRTIVNLFQSLTVEQSTLVSNEKRRSFDHNCGSNVGDQQHETTSAPLDLFGMNFTSADVDIKSTSTFVKHNIIMFYARTLIKNSHDPNNYLCIDAGLLEIYDLVGSVFEKKEDAKLFANNEKIWFMPINYNNQHWQLMTIVISRDEHKITEVLLFNSKTDFFDVMTIITLVM